MHYNSSISSQPEYKIADPICTFLFSVFVLGTTITILRDVFRILMEGNAPAISDEPSSYFFGQWRRFSFSIGREQISLKPPAPLNTQNTPNQSLSFRLTLQMILMIANLF